MSETIVITESLGGSPLSQAGRAGKLPQWFVPRPTTTAEWKEHVARVVQSVDANWLDKLAPAMAASGAASERLKRSANGKGLVVTTGQQPGLFGGPLMTLAKAITARALADELQQLTGVAVAPVFWAATDDADFNETATVSLALEGGARALMLEPRSPAGTPVARVAMGDDVSQLSDYLRDACGSVPHASYLEKALEAYRAGATIGNSYVELLRAVLEPLEIAVLDVSHPTVAVAATAVMTRAASQATALAAAVKKRNEDITAAGFRPQVDEVPGLSLVFMNDAGTKRRLTQAEAIDFKPTGDEWLSSTVLLRPVLERAMLPTAAYIAGPGELSYFAQVTAVAEALELPLPLVVPRWSTTLIEPRVQRMLDELNVSATDLADPHAVDGRLAREALSADTQAALSGLRESTNTAIDRLGNANDGTIAADVLDGLRRDIGHKLERLERRVVAGAKRRETDLMRRIATARGALYPHGIRQERKLAWLPFLARGGSPVLDAMLAAAREHARGLVSAAPSLPSPTVSTTRV
ncbi:MAG TPA: bacillithiol biosynthesis BshC [Gemmatimonadaceae bacterium]